MSSLKDHEVKWLYDHFQAISAGANFCLYLLALAFVFSLVAFINQPPDMAIPGLGASIARPVALSASVLAGAFLVVAYCGNFDKGEATIGRLACALECEYEELDFIDCHPNIFDFARHANHSVLKSRGYAGRCAAANLYSLVLSVIVLWFWFVIVHAFAVANMSSVVIALYTVAIPVLAVASRCAWRFVSRRFRTFLANERARIGNANG